VLREEQLFSAMPRAEAILMTTQPIVPHHLILGAAA